MKIKGKLNIFLQLYLILVIIRHIIAIFNAFTKIQLASYGLASVPAEIWNIFLSVIMIFSLSCILKIKRWGIYLFVVIHVINIIIQSLVFDGDLFVLIFVASVICSVLAALLCIRKNGVSAWRLFFPMNNEQPKNEHSVITENIINKDADDLNSLVTEEIDKKVFYEKEEGDSCDCESCLNELDGYISILPHKEDGSVDYEKMTLIQRFAYTYKYDSPEIALKDLKQEIKMREAVILRKKREISESTGGDRIRLRDLLREEQRLLNEQNQIKFKYGNIKCSNKRIRKKGFFTKICFSFLAIFIIVGTYVYINDKTDLTVRIDDGQQETKNGKSNQLDKHYRSKCVDELSTLYYGLLNAGYSQSAIGDSVQFIHKMYENDNRRDLYEYVKSKGDYKLDEYDVYEKKMLLDLNRRWLYDKLSKKYELGSYSSYYTKMNQEEKRKIIYKVAVDEGLEVGSFEIFNTAFQ